MSSEKTPKTENLDETVEALSETEMESVAAGYEPNPGSQHDDDYSGPF